MCLHFNPMTRLVLFFKSVIVTLSNVRFHRIRLKFVHHFRTLHFCLRSFQLTNYFSPLRRNLFRCANQTETRLIAERQQNPRHTGFRADRGAPRRRRSALYGPRNGRRDGSGLYSAGDRCTKTKTGSAKSRMYLWGWLNHLTPINSRRQGFS